MRVNRQLYKLHKAYNKHDTVGLNPGNHMVRCTGCGCWLNREDDGRYRLLRRSLWQDRDGCSSTYDIESVVRSGSNDPTFRPEEIRSLGRWLRYIGVGKPGSSTADKAMYVKRAINFRGRTRAQLDNK